VVELFVYGGGFGVGVDGAEGEADGGLGFFDGGVGSGGEERKDA
jgi:hypothetical protein